MVPVVRARSGMDDHSRGLVYDGEIFVLIQYFKRDGSASTPASGGRNIDPDGVARFDAIRGLHRGAVDLDESFVHRIGCGVRLNSGSCEARKRSSRSPACSRNDEFDVLGGHGHNAEFSANE